MILEAAQNLTANLSEDKFSTPSTSGWSRVPVKRPQQPLQKTQPHIVEPSSTAESIEDECNVIKLSLSRLPSNATFAALQEWEGYITALENGIVYAELLDLTAQNTSPEETVEFPLSELEADEQPRAVPGAIFRWVIGYFREAGTLINGSIIRFRRHTGPSNPPVQPPPLVFESE